VDYVDIRVLIGCAFLVAGAVGAVVGWRKRSAARSWPIVIGVVEQTCADKVDRYRYAPGVLYSYQVQGEFYSGQYQLKETRYTAEQATELATPWLKRKICIRYKPNDPQTSVFLPEDPPPA